METFNKVDSAIFEMLWQWAKRRHPTKGRRWVKDKYFHVIGQRKWVFTGEVEGKKGETLTIQFQKAASTAIRTGWHVHHIVYRVYGGTDNLSNLLLLHPNCHR